MDKDYGRQFQFYTIRYTIPKADIQSFVNDLHTMQESMIEECVAKEQQKGFPQVRELLDSLAR
jgi:hypothetical protein